MNALLDSRKSWLVCLTASLFFFFEFIQMQKFNVIRTDLITHFGITDVELGQLSSTYLVGDVLMLLVSGLIVDRCSIRTLMLVAMSLSTVSSLGFCLTSSVTLAGLFHFIEGASSAFCLISTVVLVSRWFSTRKQAFVIGIVITIAMLGGWVAQQPLALLTKHLQWQPALYINAVLGFVITLLIGLFVQDWPAKKCLKETALTVSMASVKYSIFKALSNPQNWFCGFYTSLLNLPIMVFGAVFGGLYLTQTYALTNEQAASVCGMLFFGTILGSPLFGFISDNLGRRKLPMVVGALFSMATLCCIIFLPFYHDRLNAALLHVLFFLLGFFTSTQVITYPTVKESNPSRIGGAALSLSSVLIMGGAAISQPIYAQLLAWHSPTVIEASQSLLSPSYKSEAFFLANAMMLGAFFVSFIMACLIRETRCRTYQETLRG